MRRTVPQASRHTDRGQTLIEFAFIAPLIFLFLFVIVDFGIALDRRITLQHAVREGARYGAVTDSVDAIKQVTVQQAQGLVPENKVTVCYEPFPLTPVPGVTPVPAGQTGSGVRVTAELKYEFPIMREILGAFGIAPFFIDMSPSGSARMERSVASPTPCQ